MTFIGRTGNHLLDALPALTLASLANDVHSKRVEAGEVLYDLGGVVGTVYFPVDAVISLLAVANGGGVEAAAIGNEGVVGVPVGGEEQTLRAIAQVTGTVATMVVDAYLRALDDKSFATLMRRYEQALFSQIAQGVVCNRLHPVDQRLAGRLLSTSNRVGRITFPITQEFLATMLGTRRATVTESAGVLAKRGLITYSRGVLTIKDRNGLEGTACVCYSLIRDALERITAASRTNAVLGTSSSGVKSVTAGVGVTITGTAADPIVNADPN